MTNVSTLMFFIFGIIWLIFMNIQGYYKMRMVIFLKRKYSKIYDKIVLIYFGGGLFIPRIINMHKFIWSKEQNKEDINFFINRIRYFKKLALLFFILTIISPFIFDVLSI